MARGQGRAGHGQVQRPGPGARGRARGQGQGPDAHSLHQREDADADAHGEEVRQHGCGHHVPGHALHPVVRIVNGALHAARAQDDNHREARPRKHVAARHRHDDHERQDLLEVGQRPLCAVEAAKRALIVHKDVASIACATIDPVGVLVRHVHACWPPRGAEVGVDEREGDVQERDAEVDRREAVGAQGLKAPADVRILEIEGRDRRADDARRAQDELERQIHNVQVARVHPHGLIVAVLEEPITAPGVRQHRCRRRHGFARSGC
mmetsp:Transcript_46363/g.119920  ORF Transcript_46363/g.119920 Transcript_46363/m.119920 type:complete len:265 (-) Transcript_46363:49-843(-)